MPGKRPPIIMTPERVVIMELQLAYMANGPRVSGPQFAPWSADHDSHI